MNRDHIILRAMPGTIKDLQKLSESSKSQVVRAIRRLRLKSLCHIGEYPEIPNQFGGGHIPAIHFAGPGIDAKRPELTAEQKAQEVDADKRRRRERREEQRLAVGKVEHLPTVQHAIRYVPNSVWALAGVRA